MIEDHMTQWFGLPVEEYAPGAGYDKVVHRLGFTYDDESFTPQVLADYLDDPRAASLVAIILGAPGESGETFDEVIKILVERAPKLGNLRGIFLGDVTQEECEISWIEQGDVGLILAAYPKLEEFRVRGGSSLVLTPCAHPALKRLYIETGGLPSAVLHGIAACSFPELEHLELWLGDSNYGWDGTIADVKPLLGLGLFPKLKSLALKNSEIQDDIAEAMASAAIVGQLEYLDMSDGTMSDVGAEHLLASESIRGLSGLDLHRNYLTDATIPRLKELCYRVDVSAQETGDEDDRYVAVGE
ncbi:STM4015 family protein [Luteolibacter sp. Populi]|uniref:STM4015 family protein n=1 Tax=Luteolibacter sp. Populi TaxID=3230487 RepID=UPI0034666D49